MLLKIEIFKRSFKLILSFYQQLRVVAPRVAEA